MKKAILKAVVVFTLAFSLFFAGVAAVSTDAGVAVCHDGPHDITYEY